MNTELLDKLCIAIRDLRKAERKSLLLADEVGKGIGSEYTKREWTKAAVERDRCFNYARLLAVEFFGFSENNNINKI